MPRNQEFFYLFLLLLILFPVLILGFRRSVSTLRAFLGTRQGEYIRETYLVKYFFAGLGILIAFIGMVLALAGFQTERDLEISDYKGTDIVFAMDISRSMLCRDIEPDRLSRAAGIARGIVDRTPGARFGVVVFKGDAVKTIPVTEDMTAVSGFLDILDPVLLSSPGSDAAEAIRCSVAAFPDLERRRKIIIIFSDGESLSGNPVEAAAEAAEKNITIFTIGTGTEPGGTIPLSDNEVLLDRDGGQVITRLNKTDLVQIAERTSGEYFPVTDPAVVSYFSSLDDQTKESVVFVKGDVDIYRVFLIISLSGFGIFSLVRVKRWKHTD